MTTAFMNPEAEQIIEAAQRVCASLTEEQVHALSSALEELTHDPSIGIEFAAAMTDLGMAVQAYDDSEDIG